MNDVNDIKHLIGIIAVIFGVLNTGTVILKGGRVSEFCAWIGWIALGSAFFL